MKIVAIIGSPHGMKGNTGTLLHGMLEAMRAEGAEVAVFSLTEYDVKPCAGCERCHITGHCAITDDFDTIQQTFAYADGLVLASWRQLVDGSAANAGAEALLAAARRPAVRVGVQTAADLGAATGDTVTVAAGSGSLTLPLLVEPSMAEGVVWVPGNFFTGSLGELAVAPGADVTVTRGGEL